MIFSPAHIRKNLSNLGFIQPPFLVISTLVILAIVSFFLYQNFQKSKLPPQVTSNLERDSITIAKRVKITGVFPNSVPEFEDVVFNNHIFEGLARIIDGQVKPALVLSWANPDKTTWRFYLRKDVKFHDGSQLSAKDVKFSIESAIANNWPNAFNLGTIDSVEVIDDFTVDIKTVRPDPVLLNRLVYAFIISENQFKTKAKEPAVGTGPYKFVSLDDEKAVIIANLDYYLGPPKVKQVIFKFYNENTTDEELVADLKVGKIDLFEFDAKPPDNQREFQIKIIADPFITFLWLDNARDKSPYVGVTPNPLKNRLVRQAIYNAIDVEKIIRQANLHAEPASQFVTDAIFGFNPQIKRPKVNIEKAKDLMRKANLEQGFSLTIDVPQVSEKIYQLIADELETIGVKVKVNVLTKEEGFERIFGKKDSSAYIVSYGAETFDAEEIFINVLHTPTDVFGSENVFGFSNLEIDELAEEIASTFDNKTRKEKLQKIMAKAVDELPMIPLYSKKISFALDDNFDWTPTAFGAIYANEITGRNVTTP